MPYTKQQQEYLDNVYRESMNQGVNPALAASLFNPDDDVLENVSRLRESLVKYGDDIDGAVLDYTSITAPPVVDDADVVSDLRRPTSVDTQGILDRHNEYLSYYDQRHGLSQALSSGYSDPDGSYGGDTEGFLTRLSKSESSDNPYAVHEDKRGRKHVGLLQFGKPRLKDYRIDTGEDFTQEEFRKDLDLQERVSSWHIKDIDRAIDRLGNSASGFSRDGLRAVAHLGGQKGMRKFVSTNGKFNPKDVEGTSLQDYYKKFSDSDPVTALEPDPRTILDYSSPRRVVDYDTLEPDIDESKIEELGLESVRLPSGEYVSVHRDTRDEELAEIKRNYPVLFEEPTKLVLSDPYADMRSEEGASLPGSFAAGLLGQLRRIPVGAQTAFAAATDNQALLDSAGVKLEDIAKMGEELAPNMIQWQDIKDAYEDKGLTSATGVAIEGASEAVAQMIGFEMPSLAAGAALGTAGNWIGNAYGGAAGGRVGTLAGRAIGYFGTKVANYLAMNLDRINSEIKEGGEPLPVEDYDLLKQGILAGGQAGLDTFATLLVGGKALLSTGSAAGLSSKGRGVLRESFAKTMNDLQSLPLVKRLGVVVLEEQVAEIAQQAMERSAAGLPISPSDEEALDEYIGIFVMTLGPSLFMGAVGGSLASRSRNKNFENHLAAESEVSGGLSEVRKEIIDDNLEEFEDSHAQQIPYMPGSFDEESIRTIQAVLAGEVTPEDVHNIARARNINSEDIGFHQMSRRKTGKSKLDDMSEAELREVYTKVASFPVQEAYMSLPVSNKDTAIDVAKKIIASGRKSVAGKTDKDNGIKSIIEALIDTNKIDRFTSTKKEKLELALAYKRRFHELGLIEVRGANENLVLTDVLKLKQTIPEVMYQSALRAGRLLNDGKFPTLEQFMEETGINDKDYYQVAIDEAIAKGDITNTEDLTLATSSPQTRFGSYYEVYEDGSKIAIYEEESGANAHKDRILKNLGRRARSGLPSTVEVVARPAEYDVYDIGKAEVISDYDYDVIEENNWVVRDADGEIVGTYPTKSKAQSVIDQRKVVEVSVGGKPSVFKGGFQEATKYKNRLVDKFEKQKLKEFVKDLVSEADPRRDKSGRFIKGKTEKFSDMGQVPISVIKRARNKARLHASRFKKSIKTSSKRTPQTGKFSAPKQELTYRLQETSTGLDTRKKSRARVVGFYNTKEEADSAKKSFQYETKGDDSFFGVEVDPAVLEEIKKDPYAFVKENIPIEPEDSTAGQILARDKLASRVREYITKNRRFNKVGLTIEETLRDLSPDDVEYSVDAAYYSVRRMIVLALDRIDLPLDPTEEQMQEAFNQAVETIDHELIHHSKALGLTTPAEWKVLLRVAATKFHPTETKGVNPDGSPIRMTFAEVAEVYYEDVSPLMRAEESVALMATEFRNNNSSVTGKTASIFRKIADFMFRLRNAINRAGFQTDDEIWSALYGGKMAERESRGEILDLYWISEKSKMEDRSVDIRTLQHVIDEIDRKLERGTARFSPMTRAILRGQGVVLREADAQERDAARLQRAIDGEEDVAVTPRVEEEASEIDEPVSESRVVKAYHGTNATFPGQIKESQMGGRYQDMMVPHDGIWFSKDIKEAKRYGTNIIETELEMKNPYRHPAEEFADEGFYSVPSITELKKRGYDSVIVKRAEWGEELDPKTNKYKLNILGEDYAVFSDQQVKRIDRAAAPDIVSESRVRTRDFSQDNETTPSDMITPSPAPVSGPTTYVPGDKGTLKALTWGHLEFDAGGNRIRGGKDIPVFVPFGSKDTMGERHIEKHDKAIEDNTPYSNGKEFLEGFFEALKVQPRGLTGGDITPHFDEWGRKMTFFWDDPNFASPGVVVMSYSGQTGPLPPHYNVITAFADTNYTQNAMESTNVTGQRRGNGASVRAVMEFEKYRRPDASSKWSRDRYKAEQKKAKESGDPVSQSRVAPSSPMSSSDENATTAMLGSQLRNRVGIIASISNQFRDQFGRSFMESARERYIDQYNEIFKGESAAYQKLRREGKIGLKPKEWAAVSATALMRMVDKSSAYAEGAFKYGSMSWTKLAGGEFYEGVPIVSEMGLDNEATDVTYFDSETGRIVSGATMSVPFLYKNGETGGFIQILAAIKNNNHDLVDKFFAYGRALRTHNKIQEGKDVPSDFLDDSFNGIPNYKIALGFAKDHPEIAVAFHNLQKWNDGFVDFAVDTGVLSREVGALWKKYADYVPFYLNLDGTLDKKLNDRLKKELGTNDDFRILNSLLPGPPSKEYKGIKHNELVDPVEATLRNVTAIITSGLANVASTRALMNAVITNDARRLDPRVPEDKDLMDGRNSRVVEVFEKGKSVKYFVNDVPLHDLLKGAFDGDIPLSGLTNMLSKPANLLREGVTRMPDFIISNTSRDAWLSWLSHKSSTDPFSATLNSIKRISSDYVAGYGADDTLGKMERTGAHGGYEGKDLKFDSLKKRLNKQINYSANPVEILSKVWKVLGEVSSLSEAAARERVFEMVHKEYLPTFTKQGKEEGLTGSDLSDYAEIMATAQAGFQSMEVLNFARRGNAPIMKFVTATIPFVNARIQGMDVFWRNGWLGENVIGLDPEAAKRAMMRRIAMAFSGSVIYAAMMMGVEDYEKEAEYTRFDNWLIPLGPLATKDNKFYALPSPFEAGLFIKLLPEQLVRLAMGESSGESLRAFNHAWTQTMALNPVPQAVKPLLEHATGHNFFTGEDIVPFYLEDASPSEQYRESTSGIAKLAGKALPNWMGMSPLEIENLMRGYLGSAFNYITFFTDYAIHRPMFGLVDKPQSLATDNPLFRRLFKGRSMGGQDFYDLRDEVGNVTANIGVLKTRSPKAAREYLIENREVLQMKGVISGIEKQLRAVRSRRHALLRKEDLSRQERMRIKQYLDDQQREIYGRASEAIKRVRSYR